MRVKRDFESLYRVDRDPWKIGDADSDRYNQYFNLIARHVRGTVLDIGCGTGAFLARCTGASRLVGVEISGTAIEAGRARSPHVEFIQGSAGSLSELSELSVLKCDLIVCSDVIYYLSNKEKVRLLEWMAAHLTPRGAVFLAAWCPGGKYLTVDELTDLAGTQFVTLERQMLESSGHLALLLRARRQLAAITVDYETWQPIPAGKTIDWTADIFAPADRLAAIGEACGASITFFVEMGEYFWLCEHDPDVARRMEEQWRDLARRGHDLQLHLHPSWLPELGAAKTPDGWHWNWNLAKAHDYPGDLSAVIRRCKDALESAVRRVDPDYRVTCFRAGAYQAQPFERLHDALVQNGIVCDSSVYQGGYSEERGYDYREARSSHQPYFASRVDPQYESSNAAKKLVELPIFTYSPDARCFIDGSEGSRFADAFLAQLPRRRINLRARRALGRLPRALRALLTPARDGVDMDNYFVLIGHTKADLDGNAIMSGLRSLQRLANVQFAPLSTLAATAVAQLSAPAAVAARHAMPARPSAWQRAIPLDRSAILILGDDAARRAQSLGAARPWARVESDRGMFGADGRLVFGDGEFDCIYVSAATACDSPEKCAELRRLLSDGGALVFGGRWSAFSRLEERLQQAGFSGITVHRAVHRRAAALRCWAVRGGYSSSVRVRQAMAWLYQHVSPERSHSAWRVADILSSGHAFCAGYASALGQILRHDGYRVRWLSMEARGHVRGRGSDGNEHHEVITALVDGQWMILDPMTNTLLPHDLESLLKRPALAVSKSTSDRRYQARGYEFYDTRYWYSRVVRYSYRTSPRVPPLIWKSNKWNVQTSTPIGEASPLTRIGD
jgi:SAM-dependent methyltransferase